MIVFVYIIVSSPGKRKREFCGNSSGNKETTSDAARRPCPQIARFKLTSTMQKQSDPSGRHHPKKLLKVATPTKLLESYL